MKNWFLGVLAFCAAFAHANTTPVPDIAPSAQGQYVVINIPQQRLFLYNNGRLQKVYPVAVGKAMTQTTLGEHRIGAKAFNPTWHIPLSIQRERGDGVKSVPPGPRNPLGPVFVRLGEPRLGLGIHGTSNPGSVPGVASHGCVRMKSPDALEFARTITSGTTVMVSYEMAALNQDGAGNLWLAVFRDPYNKRNLRVDALKHAITEWGRANRRSIETAKVDQALRARSGKPVCLTCGNQAGKIQGSLLSVAWNQRSAALTAPKGGNMSVRPAQVDEILPEGTEIEVDAIDASELPPFKATSVFGDAEPIGSIPLRPIRRR